MIRLKWLKFLVAKLQRLWERKKANILAEYIRGYEKGTITSYRLWEVSNEILSM